jgi:hypothetical protein
LFVRVTVCGALTEFNTTDPKLNVVVESVACAAAETEDSRQKSSVSGNVTAR